MARLFKKGKTALASSVLNILGLTAAFAALYIILVQVHHDLAYNKGLKDSVRIYVLTMPNRSGGSASYQVYVNRPMAEAAIDAVPNVEVGGCGELYGTQVSARLGEGQSPIELKTTSFSRQGLDVFGFELVAGSWDNWIDPDKDVALSESAAKRMGLQVGDHFQYGYWNWRDASLVAIYKDMPVNSDLSSFDMVQNLGEEGLDNWQQWGFNYFVKLTPGTDPKEFEEIAEKIAVDLWVSTMELDASAMNEEEKAHFE